MFFEGSEKKIEIVCKAQNFFAWPRSFWDSVVKASKAQILSSIETEQCKAYLLSESSLFVWPHRMTMITCGNTDLVSALSVLLKKIPQGEIELLIYERKNEYFSYYQDTHFFDDIKKLKELFPGKALQFGNTDEHHLFLFSTDKIYKPEKDDMTLEVLMYGLRGKAKELFTYEGATRDRVRQEFELFNTLPGFEIDDHLFDPMGYSLNATRGEDYYTIHVTPQEHSPYVSFETNMTVNDNYEEVINKVIAAFQPLSFDIVAFRPENPISIPCVKDYKQKSRVTDKLSCEYYVSYGHFYEPENKDKNAYEIKLEEYK